ncbi:MAG: alanyl-tRNA editing protein [Candidatus Nanoarchaeia archaeon]|nr:alanyl-tRNA editing protein [Candidatus Nanoarchaeia archaeon]
MWMDEAKYLNDCYVREFETEVLDVNDKFVVLKETFFYPNSGGQPHDLGYLINENGDRFDVVFVAKLDEHISHEVDKTGLKKGMKVKCFIDWDRRYQLMRIHSAMHVLSGFIFQELGVIVGGNNIDLDKSRVDFILENFDRDLFYNLVEKANEFIKNSVEIKKYILLRDEAMKDESLFRLTKDLPENLDRIRVVEIDGFDKQACGGTHLNNVDEIGRIELLKLENKGKNNRRMYFTVI